MDDDLPLASVNRREAKLDAAQGKAVLLAVRKILSRPRLLDVTFVCEEDQEVPANRTLLASRSKYFAKLLYRDMKESSMERIPLPTVKAGSLQVVISFLHGCPFWWEPDRCADGLVDMYVLAKQYQVNSLCRRILLSVSTRRYRDGREVGDLLKAALSRQADKISSNVVRVIYADMVFDSKFFLGWTKDAITSVLSSAWFQPYVTEALIAKAVLLAAPGVPARITVDAEQDTEVCALGPSPATCDSGAKKAEDPPTSTKSAMPPGLRASGVKIFDAEPLCSLSWEDVKEIFEQHIDLPFIEPSFVVTWIEPLQILQPKILTALYSAVHLLFSWNATGRIIQNALAYHNSPNTYCAWCGAG
ncbi:hypothetical protein CBR_g45782 [Chara braunii]|uniref:BTB domain-containing protein n=1 Tax=Chara braunii TaxID=69332 RepID=A0A388LZ75_CHABU|nr:hypothetical protein CBR_g45782 [Chara braunii]|eukprot:GBG87630.1 hypothetical protein CBR_g45782 [Chara braunii]